jgi:heterodisulfide reductase subunit C
MGYFEKLDQDVRFRDGLKACLNCGICTAVCPAAEFRDYDPRKIMVTLQRRNEEELMNLLRGETIWNCGQCMSCKTRCPRDNTPGMVIQALRKLSQESGMFVHSEAGRQQLDIKRTIGRNLLRFGFCVHPDTLDPDKHPEQGPVWEWIFENRKDVYDRLGANIYREGAGAVRDIDEKSMNELRSIFTETGADNFFQLIEYFSNE